MRLDDLGHSTPLESNKSVLRNYRRQAQWVCRKAPWNRHRCKDGT